MQVFFYMEVYLNSLKKQAKTHKRPPSVRQEGEIGVPLEVSGEPQLARTQSVA